MPSDNSGPGKFQLDSKRSFCPAVGSSSYAGNGHLYRSSLDAGNGHSHPGRWRDVYGQSFIDLQLNALQLNGWQLNRL
jgi:hypothetical protein